MIVIRICNSIEMTKIEGLESVHFELENSDVAILK